MESPPLMWRCVFFGVKPRFSPSVSPGPNDSVVVCQTAGTFIKKSHFRKKRKRKISRLYFLTLLVLACEPYVWPPHLLKMLNVVLTEKLTGTQKTWSPQVFNLSLCCHFWAKTWTLKERLVNIFTYVNMEDGAAVPCRALMISEHRVCEAMHFILSVTLARGDCTALGTGSCVTAASRQPVNTTRRSPPLRCNTSLLCIILLHTCAVPHSSHKHTQTARWHRCNVHNCKK